MLSLFLFPFFLLRGVLADSLAAKTPAPVSATQTSTSTSTSASVTDECWLAANETYSLFRNRPDLNTSVWDDIYTQGVFPYTRATGTTTACIFPYVTGSLADDYTTWASSLSSYQSSHASDYASISSVCLGRQYMLDFNETNVCTEFVWQGEDELPCRTAMSNYTSLSVLGSPTLDPEASDYVTSRGALPTMTARQCDLPMVNHPDYGANLTKWFYSAESWSRAHYTAVSIISEQCTDESVWPTDLPLVDKICVFLAVSTVNPIDEDSSAVRGPARSLMAAVAATAMALIMMGS